jgi:WD40 repeat protein
MDGTVKLWDVETGKLRRRLEGNRAPVGALAFSRDGQFFATAGDVKENNRPQVEVLLWTTKTWEAKKMVLKDDVTRVTALAFSPDGSTLALGRTAPVKFGPDTEKGPLKAPIKPPSEFRLWKRSAIPDQPGERNADMEIVVPKDRTVPKGGMP